MMISAVILFAVAGGQSVAADLAELSRDHVNVALSAWGYSHATASSVYGPSWEADRAIDGKWALRDEDKWASALGKGPHWIVVDLGHPFVFDAIALRHEGVVTDGPIYNTSDFEVQRSDSPKGPWIDLVPAVKDNHADISLLRFQKVRSRYVRFITTKAEQHGNDYARLYEFEVYALQNTLDVPLFKFEWPGTPTYRHMGGRLETEVELNTPPSPRIGAFKVDGRRIAMENGNLWLPAGEGPVTVTYERPGCPKASWKMIDDRAWLAAAKGGGIDVLSSSHQDVAWIDTPDWCRDNRVKLILEPAIDLMEREPAYRFTMENMLNLRELLELRPQRKDEIEKLIRSGQLEFGGTYNQPYESLLGGEQLIRQVYFGRRWLRKLFPGTDTCVAYTVDVPGRSLQMQQILAKSGIRYLVTSRYHEGLFRWASPDGSSILVYALSHYGNHGSLLKADPPLAVRQIPGAIKDVAKEFAKRGVPPHYMLLNSGDFEGPMSFGPLLDRWANQGPIAEVDGKPVSAPVMGYSSTAGFFKKLDIPSAKPKNLMGERPNMWLYIHGPTHQECIQAQREAARLLPAAETFATIRCLLEGSFASYPAARLSGGWLDTLYADHGFGGKNGHITDGVFHAKFVSGLSAAKSTLALALPAIANRVKVNRLQGSPFVVFNSHSWRRTDVVSVSAPTQEPGWHVVDADGRPVPSQEDCGPTHENVATPTMGARVLPGHGVHGERLLEADWWDARKGWWEATASLSAPAEVVIDLGATRFVDRLLIRHYGAFGEFQKEEAYNTRGFRVFGSTEPGAGRKEIAPPVVANDKPVSVLEFAPVAIRYLKLQIDAPDRLGGGMARLLGVEAFASVPRSSPLVTFTAKDVPSVGYKLYYLLRYTHKAATDACDAVRRSIENDFYRIKLKPGGIESIYDKQAQAELLRPCGLTGGDVFTMKSEGNGAGEFGAVQQPTMEGFDRTSAHGGEWHFVPTQTGPVCTTYESLQQLGGAMIRRRLVVYNQVKKIDFDVDLEGWRGDKYREFRLALPVGGPKAEVSYEVPMGTVNVGKDEIKTTGGRAYGSLDYWQQCSDIHPREVQDCIRVRDRGVTTTLSSCVSVFDYIDPTGLAGKGPLIQPILLASRKSCHGEGNWYTQPGDHRYHFSITSSKNWDSGPRAAADGQSPLLSAFVNSSGGTLPASLSFASINAENVRISTIKRAEDDDSVVVRCYDVDGRAVDAMLSLFLPVKFGVACNMIEDESTPLKIDGGRARMHIGRFAIETLKLKR